MSSFHQQLKTLTHYYLVGPYWMVGDQFHRNRCSDYETGDHTGEVAVITGGHRGIGAEVSKCLLSAGMHLILGCRKTEDGLKFLKKLHDEGVRSGSAIVLSLDLTSLDSVRDFAKAVLEGTEKINVLINNAGIFSKDCSRTADGMDTHWQVNYLSTFLLSHLLYPRLQAAQSTARIVNVTSTAHHAASYIDYLDLETAGKDPYLFDGMTTYARTKAAQIMFTLFLNEKLKSRNSNVEVVAVHPGLVNTDIFHDSFMSKHLAFIPKMFFRTPELGGKVVVFAALYGKGGEYICDNRPETPSSLCLNTEEQQRLFDISKRILKLESCCIDG